ncbi:MAG TPA: hypothetical protein VNO33_06990, partial [Kofleriaceae bacterium]|nr:hypothetical protein [Kofleriaceae bacterium]
MRTPRLPWLPWLPCWVVAVVAAWPADAGPARGTAVRRPGKVVRVERPRVRAAERVRVCPLTTPDGRRMTCFGGTAPE